MHSPSPEHIFFNAVALAVESSYPRLQKLNERHETWEEAWQEIVRSPHAPRDPGAAWEELDRAGIRLLLSDNQEYPPLLREIPYPPFGIYARGSLPSADTPAVAIVGTRRATASGRETARSFARALAASGVTVISGLAFGVDAAAHEGALEGGGITVAVLANGLDRIYPASHTQLAEQMLAGGGALISEYPLGSPTLAYRFLERNRIVSGLTLGSVIIEAPPGSGSLATARFATEQNRAVFVVPGPAQHANFSGSHELIRDGAELVTDPEQVLTALNLAPPPGARPAQERTTREPSGAGTHQEELVLQALRAETAPLHVDAIALRTNLEVRLVTQTLTHLTLKGRVKESGEGYIVS